MSSPFKQGLPKLKSICQLPLLPFKSWSSTIYNMLILLINSIMLFFPVPEKRTLMAISRIFVVSIMREFLGVGIGMSLQ